MEEVKRELERILGKIVTEFTEEEIAFLKARRGMLNEVQLERVKHLFEDLAEGEKNTDPQAPSTPQPQVPPSQPSEANPQLTPAEQGQTNQSQDRIVSLDTKDPVIDPASGQQGQGSTPADGAQIPVQPQVTTTVVEQPAGALPDPVVPPSQPQAPAPSADDLVGTDDHSADPDFNPNQTSTDGTQAPQS